MRPSPAHRRGVLAYRAGSAQIWVTCAAARRIVGDYTNGATAAFAHDLARSCDSVERYAAAGRVYRLLRRTYGDIFPADKSKAEQERARRNSATLRKLQDARQVLGYSHFAALARAWSEYEFSPAQAREYILDAAERHTPVELFRNEITPEKAEPGQSGRAVVLPSWAVGEGMVRRLMEEKPSTRILIIDGLPPAAEYRVTPVKP